MGAAERQVLANQSFERIVARRSIQVDTDAVVTISMSSRSGLSLLSKGAYSEHGCKPTAAASWRRLRRRMPRSANNRLAACFELVARFSRVRFVDRHRVLSHRRSGRCNAVEDATGVKDYRQVDELAVQADGADVLVRFDNTDDLLRPIHLLRRRQVALVDRLDLTRVRRACRQTPCACAFWLNVSSTASHYRAGVWLGQRDLFVWEFVELDFDRLKLLHLDLKFG